MRSTIVLIHGAFAESASWNRVIPELLASGHPVVAVANPLQGLASDAAAVSAQISAIEGPVVLVAHSYGGAVMSNVDPDAGDISALVYVNGFAPEPGDSCFALAGKFPGSTLGPDTLQIVQRRDGLTDLSILRERFAEIFAADVDPELAAVFGATQRPATQEALTEPSGDRPLWRTVPSWFVIGEEDRIIPPALQHFMAERAQARGVASLPGASHAAAVSQPSATVRTILEAAALQPAVA